MNAKSVLMDIFCGIVNRIKVSRKSKVAKVVDPEKCTYCGQCEISCPPRFKAIQIDKYEGISIDVERCNGCGRCKRVCKEHVIEILKKENDKKIFQSKCTKSDSRVKTWTQ